MAVWELGCLGEVGSVPHRRTDSANICPDACQLVGLGDDEIVDRLTLIVLAGAIDSIDIGGAALEVQV